MNLQRGVSSLTMHILITVVNVCLKKTWAFCYPQSVLISEYTNWHADLKFCSGHCYKIHFLLFWLDQHMYSRHSLSRNPSASLKYFEISVHRYIKIAKFWKNKSNNHTTSSHMNISSWGGGGGMHQLDRAPKGLPRRQTIANSVCTSRRSHVDKKLPILYVRRDAPT